MTAGQQPLVGMPERLLRASPSKLSTWLDCPRRYRMTYLDRPSPPKGPAWGHHSVGTAVHDALRDVVALPPAQRTPERAAALVDRHLRPEGFRDDEQRESWRLRARAMVAEYVAGLEPDFEPLSVERRVATKTAVLALEGRIDRLDERDDELVVVDYKTSRRPPTTDDVRSSFALAVYAAATERTLRRRCRTVELHHVPTGTVVSWEHTDESLERQLRRLDAIGTEARAAETAWQDADGSADVDAIFPARPGPMCGWCDLVRQCPAGSAVASPREPWAGLGELAAAADGDAGELEP